MESKDITQAQMANELKIPKTTVSSWMNGRRMPRAAAMSAICHYLNCTREDLLRLPGEPKKEFKPLPQEPPQTVQESVGAVVDDTLGLALDALDAAGYGHLRDLVQAAAGADEKSLAFVTGILQRNQK